MLDELGSLTGRRRSNYETLSSGHQGTRQILGIPTFRTCLLVTLMIGLGIGVLYSASTAFSTSSGSDSLLLSSGNGFSGLELDSNSSFDVSPEENADALSIAEGMGSENQEFCFLFDENTGKNNGIENVLWYFRENYFFNSHHYFWHTYYTDNFSIMPDRAGELFYFMHHEFLARYFNERWSAGLSLPPLLYFHNVTLIAEGYDPHLTALVVGLVPPARPPNQYLKDVFVTKCNPFNVTLERVAQLEGELNEAIKAGYLTKTDGSKLAINGLNGVGIFAQELYRRYGYPYWLKGVNYQQSGLGFHGVAHVIIAGVMDPTGSKNLCMGVMNGNSVPMFDPIFYRFHGMLDEMFIAIKRPLEPYSPLGSDFPLLWRGVKVLGIEVKESHNDQQPNQLHTHWATKAFNARFGIDWQKNGTDHNTPICQKQLDYEKFQYKIIYENPAAESRATTVRIFLAPRFNEHGHRIPINEQYLLFFTLDRFTTTLKPGKNEIHRLSQESSLTLPESVWLEIKNRSYDERFCGCGLPENFLLPKGTKEGKVYDLFVMLTDGVEDAVENQTEPKPGACQSAPVWCTNYGRKYEDAKPMGYPFDRRPYEIVHGNSRRPLTYLEEYMEGIGNMHATQITIRHLD